MKLGKILKSMSALLCTSLLGVDLWVGKAAAQTQSPYIVLVNGYNNCCAWGITDRFPSMNAEVRAVPYSNFSNGGRSGATSNDSAFLQEGADFINNQLDRSRPLILIGHSFGGDSVLKLLPRINRQIQFVAVIDPVRTGGFRRPLKNLRVPSNVEYFYNRWQENMPFPNDFKTSGSISCGANQCDQDSQNIARNADSSAVTTECRWDEVTCPGFVAPIPFVREGRKGRQQVRVSHQDLPRDAFLQTDLGKKIKEQLSAATVIDQIQGVHNQVIGGDGGPLYVNAAKDILRRGTLQDVRNFLVDNFSETPIQRVHNESIGGNGGPLYVNAGKAILRRDGASLEDVRNFLRRDFGGK